jgi:hypothetical protein
MLVQGATVAAVVALLTLPASHAWPSSDLTNRAGRIVGGQDAAAGEVPYAVSLELSDNNSCLTCGGILLNLTTVLTAAHCTKYSAERLQVRAGSLVRLDFYPSWILLSVVSCLKLSVVLGNRDWRCRSRCSFRHFPP